jgi:hypothetical protein
VWSACALYKGCRRKSLMLVVALQAKEAWSGVLCGCTYR